jgi:hypothetical protein
MRSYPVFGKLVGKQSMADIMANRKPQPPDGPDVEFKPDVP